MDFLFVGVCVSGVSSVGVSGVSEVSEVSEVSGGVECRGCRAMSMSFDNLDTTRSPRLSRSLDTGVGVSGLSVGLVSVDTGVGVSGGVGRCRDRVSECRARAQDAAWCASDFKCVLAALTRSVKESLG